jgi:hypothetical protein
MYEDECGGTAKPYEHHDEGFLVDLGEAAAAANPLNIPLSGPAANVVTRGYHLSAMSGNRLWGPRRLDPEHGHATRSDIVRGDQRRIRAARRGQPASLTRRSRRLRSAVMPAALSGQAANSPLEMQDPDGTDCAPPGASAAGRRVGGFLHAFLHASVGALARSRSRPSCRDSATQAYECLARRPSTDH